MEATGRHADRAGDDWVRAEEYHQDYLIKHPDGYNDHWLRDFDF